MTKRLSWLTRIEQAEKRGRFTAVEQHELAAAWNRCAVGERHHWPKNEEFALTIEEDDLGMHFLDAVRINDFPAARRFYEEIMAQP